MTGLKIRCFGGKFAVCSGHEDDNPEEYGLGTVFSEWYDTWKEANDCRNEIYDIVSQELQDAALEYDNKDYENASKFLDAKYDL